MLLKWKMRYYMLMAKIAFELGSEKYINKYTELYTKCLNQL